MEWLFIAGSIAAGTLLLWICYSKFVRKQDAMTEEERHKNWIDQQW